MDKLDFEALAKLEALARIDRGAESQLWDIVAEHLRANRKQIGAYQTTLAELYRRWKGITKDRRGNYQTELRPLSLAYCFADLALRKDKRDDTGKRRTLATNRKDADGKRIRLPAVDVDLIQPSALADKRASEADTARARLTDATTRAALSIRERAILSALLRGDSQTTIAALVGRSQQSVSRDIAEIFAKLAKNIE